MSIYNNENLHNLIEIAKVGQYLANAKYTLKRAQRIEILSDWRNLAKSGHTDLSKWLIFLLSVFAQFLKWVILILICCLSLQTWIQFLQHTNVENDPPR